MDTSQWEVIDRRGTRYLHLAGETSWSQSSMPLGAPHALVAPYMRASMLFVLFQRPRDVLLLGLGAGSQAKYLLHEMADTRVVCVELDPEVPAIARRWFHLPEDHPRLKIVIGDATQHVADRPDPADVVLVDCYQHGATVPEAITCPGFYRALHTLLRPGGVAVFNFYRFGTARLEAQFAALGMCFGAVRIVWTPPDNAVVFALRDGIAEAPGTLVQRAAALEASYRLGLPGFARQVIDQAGLDSRALAEIAVRPHARSG